GLLAFQRAAVYRELGLPPPPIAGNAVPASASAATPPRPAPTLQAVKDALRGYGSPARLAGNAMAPPDARPAQRAAEVQARIDEAVRAAFGSSREDQLLLRVLTRGYLDPAPTHEQAAVELGLSRTGYFRHLRAAVARVAAQLGVEPAGTNVAPSRH